MLIKNVLRGILMIRKFMEIYVLSVPQVKNLRLKNRRITVMAVMRDHEK